MLDAYLIAWILSFAGLKAFKSRYNAAFVALGVILAMIFFHSLYGIFIYRRSDPTFSAFDRGKYVGEILGSNCIALPLATTVALVSLVRWYRRRSSSQANQS